VERRGEERRGKERRGKERVMFLCLPGVSALSPGTFKQYLTVTTVATLKASKIQICPYAMKAYEGVNILTTV
jgi:hypothetical protein